MKKQKGVPFYKTPCKNLELLRYYPILGSRPIILCGHVRYTECIPFVQLLLESDKEALDT